MELINVKNEYYATPNGHLDGVRHKRGGCSRFESRNVYELLARFAILLDDREKGGEFGLFHADEEGGTPLVEESAGRSDYGEFVASFHELIGDAPFIAVMNDANG